MRSNFGGGVDDTVVVIGMVVYHVVGIAEFKKCRPLPGLAREMKLHGNLLHLLQLFQTQTHEEWELATFDVHFQENIIMLSNEGFEVSR
jgi:hypothetical protein